MEKLHILSTAHVPVDVHVREGEVEVITASGKRTKDFIVGSPPYLRGRKTSLETIHRAPVVRDAAGRPCLKIGTDGMLVADGSVVRVSVKTSHAEVRLQHSVMRLVYVAYHNQSNSEDIRQMAEEILHAYAKHRSSCLRDPVICMLITRLARAMRGEETPVDLSSVLSDFMQSTDDLETVGLYMLLHAIGPLTNYTTGSPSTKSEEIVRTTTENIIQYYTNTGSVRRVKAPRVGSAMRIKGLAETLGHHALDFGIRDDIDMLGDDVQRAMGALLLGQNKSKPAFEMVTATRTVFSESLEDGMITPVGSAGPIIELRNLLRTKLVRADAVLEPGGMWRVPLPTALFIPSALEIKVPNYRPVTPDNLMHMKAKEQQQLLDSVSVLLSENMWSRYSMQVALSVIQTILLRHSDITSINHEDHFRRRLVQNAEMLKHYIEILYIRDEKFVASWAGRMLLVNSLFARAVDALRTVSDTPDAEPHQVSTFLRHVADSLKGKVTKQTVSSLAFTTAKWSVRAGLNAATGIGTTATLSAALMACLENSLLGYRAYSALIGSTGSAADFMMRRPDVKKNTDLRASAMIASDIAMKIASELNPCPEFMLKRCQTLYDIAQITLHDPHNVSDALEEMTELVEALFVPPDLRDRVIEDGYDRAQLMIDSDYVTMISEAVAQAQRALPVILRKISASLTNRGVKWVDPINDTIRIIRRFINTFVNHDMSVIETGNEWVRLTNEEEEGMTNALDLNVIVKRKVEETMETIDKENQRPADFVLEIATGLSLTWEKLTGGFTREKTAQFTVHSVVNGVFDYFIPVLPVDDGLLKMIAVPFLHYGVGAFLTPKLLGGVYSLIGIDTGKNTRLTYSHMDAALVAASLATSDIIDDETWIAAEQNVDKITLIAKNGMRVDMSAAAALGTCKDGKGLGEFFPAIARELSYDCPLCRENNEPVGQLQFQQFGLSDIVTKIQTNQNALRLFYIYAARHRGWTGKVKVLTSIEGALARDAWDLVGDEVMDVYVNTREDTWIGADDNTRTIRDKRIKIVGVQDILGRKTLEVIDIYPHIAQRGSGYRQPVDKWYAVILEDAPGNETSIHTLNLSSLKVRKEKYDADKYQRFIRKIRDHIKDITKAAATRLSTIGGAVPIVRKASSGRERIISTLVHSIILMLSGALGLFDQFLIADAQVAIQEGTFNETILQGNHPILQNMAQMHFPSNIEIDYVASTNMGQNYMPMLDSTPTLDLMNPLDLSNSLARVNISAPGLFEPRVIADPWKALLRDQGHTDPNLQLSGDDGLRELYSQEPVRIQPDDAEPVPEVDEPGEPEEQPQKAGIIETDEDDSIIIQTGSQLEEPRDRSPQIILGRPRILDRLNAINTSPVNISPKVRDSVAETVNSTLETVQGRVIQEIDLQKRARVELGTQKDEFMLRSMSLSPDEIMATQDPDTGPPMLQVALAGGALGIAHALLHGMKKSSAFIAGAAYASSSFTLETGYSDSAVLLLSAIITRMVISLFQHNVQNSSLPKIPVPNISSTSFRKAAAPGGSSTPPAAQGRAPDTPGGPPLPAATQGRAPDTPGGPPLPPAAQGRATDTPGGSPENPATASNAFDSDLDKILSDLYKDHGEVVEFRSIERVADVTTAAIRGIAYERPLVLFAQDFSTGLVGDCSFIDDLRHKNSMPELINEMRCMLQCGRMPVLVLDVRSSLDVLGAVTETFVQYNGLHGARIARFIVPEGELRVECARLWGVGGQRSAIIAVFGEDMITDSLVHFVNEGELENMHLCYSETDSHDCARAHLSDIIYQWVYPVVVDYKVGYGVPSPKVRDSVAETVNSALETVQGRVTQEIDLQKRARVELGIQKDEFMLRSMSLSPDEIMAIQDPWEDLRLLYEGTKEVIGAPGSYKRNAFLFSAIAVRLATYVIAATTIFQVYGVVVAQLAVGIPVGLTGKFMAALGSSPSSLAAFATQLPTMFVRLITNNQLMLLLFGGSTLTSTFESLQPYPALYKMAMRATRRLPLGILRWVMNSRSCQTFGINMLMYSNMAISLYTGTQDFGARVNNQMKMNADAKALDQYSLRYLLRMVRELCKTDLGVERDTQDPEAFLKVIGRSLESQARQYSRLSHPDKITNLIERQIQRGIDVTNKELLKQRADKIQSDLTKFKVDFVNGFEEAYEQYKNTIDTMMASEDPELSTFSSSPVRVMFDAGNDVLPATGVEIDPARLKALCDPEHFDEGYAVLTADDHAVLFESYADPVITGPTEAASVANATLAKTESMDPDERLTAVENTLLTLPERRYDVNTWESWNPMNIVVNKRDDPNTLHSPEHPRSPVRRNVLSELENKLIVRGSGEPVLRFTDEVPEATYAGLSDGIYQMVLEAITERSTSVGDFINTERIKSLLPKQEDLARTEDIVTGPALEELVRCLHLVTRGFIGVAKIIDAEKDVKVAPIATMLSVHASSAHGVGRGLLAELIYWSRAIEDRKFESHVQEMQRLVAMTDARLRVELGVSDPAIPVGVDRIGEIPLAVLVCIAARPRERLYDSAGAAGAAAAVAAYVRDGDDFLRGAVEAIVTAAGLYHTIIYAMEGLSERVAATESIVPAHMGEDGRHVCKFIEMVATRFGTQDLVVPLLTSHHDIWRDVWWPLVRPE
jgi:phosphoribosylformylglycinamidine (FGAM) synthase PurS component